MFLLFSGVIIVDVVLDLLRLQVIRDRMPPPAVPFPYALVLRYTCYSVHTLLPSGLLYQVFVFDDVKPNRYAVVLFAEYYNMVQCGADSSMPQSYGAVLSGLLLRVSYVAVRCWVEIVRCGELWLKSVKPRTAPHPLDYNSLRLLSWGFFS